MQFYFYSKYSWPFQINISVKCCPDFINKNHAYGFAIPTSISRAGKFLFLSGIHQNNSKITESQWSVKSAKISANIFHSSRRREGAGPKTFLRIEAQHDPNAIGWLAELDMLEALSARLWHLAVMLCWCLTHTIRGKAVTHLVLGLCAGFIFKGYFEGPLSFTEK